MNEKTQNTVSGLLDYYKLLSTVFDIVALISFDCVLVASSLA